MNSEQLTVSLIQSPLHWLDPQANFKAFEAQINSVPKSDLYILPEMFSTGFCMHPEKAQPKTGEMSLEWMIKQARIHDISLCGSTLYETSPGIYVNRMFLIDSIGSITHYDKWHRFALAGEDKAYQKGSNKPVIANIKGWKILLQVCYDLRFPVFSRNKPDGYDAVIYVANWPEKRANHWRQLLIARAIENQAYCIGVNRIGEDQNKLSYAGDSLCINPLGEIELDLQNEHSIKSVTLSKGKIEETRTKLPFLQDADPFKIST